MSNPDPAQIAIAQDQLRQSGIASTVQNENFGSLYGTGSVRLHQFSEPKLVVFRKDFRRAAEVLGVPVPDGFDDDGKRERRPGLIGWLRWISGLD